MNPDHWGLRLDQRKKDCAADSFGGNAEADTRYPGVQIGSRGTTVSEGRKKIQQDDESRSTQSRAPATVHRLARGVSSRTKSEA